MSEFRQLLEQGDVQAIRGAWAQLFPHLPQVETYEQAEVVMHHARTQMQSIAFKHRAWSHRWLTERSLPSGLPDTLRPRAERLYPVVVDAVGVSINTSVPQLRPAMLEVRRDVCDAVEDAYAAGHKDPVFLKQRMNEVRDQSIRKLFGRIGS